MPDTTMHWRKRRRITAMLYAYMHFHARKFPQAEREASCWLLLFVWASLGGTADEVITGDSNA